MFMGPSILRTGTILRGEADLGLDQAELGVLLEEPERRRLVRAEREGEAVPARLGEVVELVGVHVHAARRDLVQQGLPEVRARAVDERHVRPALAGEAVAD